MKLEVGMYVRTKDGYIGKLNIKKETIAVAQWTGDYKLEEITRYFINDNRYNEFEIIEASNNIIDLIEVGDYVNGFQIIEVPYMENGKIIYKLHCGNNLLVCNENYKIKSIVTKEMFESMQYKVD